MSDDTDESRSASSGSKVHPHRHLKYMDPTSTMTLREGLEEYYTTIENLITEENASSPEIGELFHFHDVCHVLFGCDTSIHGEALVDTWSIFGTTVTLKTYQKYLAASDTQSIFESMTFDDMMEALTETTTQTPKAFWRATHMTKKWPFREHEQHLDRPLNELREEFGIEVIA